MKNTANNKNIPLRFGSGKTAAARLGIPADVIAWCRQHGCAAFEDSNRVRTLPLLSFIGERLLRAIRLGAFEKPENDWLDPQQEKAKLDAARRRELEDAEKLRRGELHVLADVEQKVWSEVLSPPRDGIMNLSRICASPCNPQDVALATKVLDAYAARIFKTINSAAPEELPEDDPVRVANQKISAPAITN
jgi:hypothetical protein